MRLIALAVAASALAACARHTDYVPVSQSPADAALSKARYECEAAWNTSTGSLAARDKLYQDCMLAHGYAPAS